MRRDRSVLLLLLVLGLLVLAFPIPSSAYLENIWLSGTGVELIQGPGTIRLAGMGNLTVAIEDVNNQVDLYDFTGNVASLVMDKTTDDVDSWESYGKWTDQKNDFRWQDIGIWQGGALLVLRGKDRYAGGATLYTRTLDVNRVDDSNLRKILRVGFPTKDFSISDTSLVDTEVNSSSIDAYYAHQVMGKAYLGAHGWGTFDSETRPVKSLYDLKDKVDDLGGGLGLVVLATKWLQVGGTVDLGSQIVEARSSDAFHDDSYTRKRGIVTFSTQALLNFQGKLRGVLNYKHSSFDADQNLNMNWSGRFILNPKADEEIRRKLKISTESDAYNLFATRWIFTGLRLPLTVSAYFDKSRDESSLHNLPNVLVWVRQYDEVLDQWNLRGGASYKIGAKGLAGMEVRFNRGKLEDLLPLEESLQNFRTVDVRAGGEYRLVKWLALRAGYSVARESRVMGVPEEDFNWNTISAGAGGFLMKDRLTIDAAFVNQVIKPKTDLGDGRETKFQTLMLYGRFLF